jgi:cyanobactin maturation PatA/PatG family protease
VLICAGAIAMSDQMLMSDGRTETAASESARMNQSLNPGLTPATSGQIPDVQPPHVVPSEGCGCATCRAAQAASPPGLVFALGQIGYDLVSEARRDSIQQHMDGDRTTPGDPTQLLAYLGKNPWEAASIVWTLSNDQTPIYALLPAGPFAAETYARFREFLADQLKGNVDRISIPGRLMGRAQLFGGQTLPVIVPELRGMYSWTTDALLMSIAGAPPASAKDAKTSAYSQKVQAVRGFLERVYYELRNLGVSSQHRAVNYAATNAFQIQSVYESSLKDSMELDSIDVEKSMVCRPESDCWDVKLTFFYPERQVQTVRKVYRFTVDVSDVVPVTVGPVRSWLVR